MIRKINRSLAFVLSLAFVSPLIAATPNGMPISGFNTIPPAAATYDDGTLHGQVVSSTHPLPIAGTITPSGTQDTNLKQVNGATVNVGTGAASTGTQRVTTSTDSTIGTVTAVTAITNALPAGTNLLGKAGIDQTTPGTTNGVVVNSSALPTGASTSALQTTTNTNLTTINTTLGSPFQAGGSIGNTSFGATQATAANLNATIVGAGTAGAATGGILTVQGVASMTKLLVTPDSVALPANQSVNVSQFNGVTPLMGNGVAGTGAQRVTIASDNTAFSVNATLQTGANVVGGVTVADGSDATLGAKADAAWTSGSGSAIAVLKAIDRDTLLPLAAGTAIIGKAGIDQTTDVTTNGVEIAPTAGAAAGITPVIAGSSASNAVLKAAAGNLYSVSVTTGATQGWLMVFNATTKPTDGTTTAGTASGNLQLCLYASANSTTAASFNPGPPDPYTVGITAVFSSTGCGTLTASATAFIRGSAK